MTTSLRALDEAIADAESRADRAFFEGLLHPRFVMIRPSGLVATRGEFLDGLVPGDRRAVADVEVTPYPTRRAVVRCTVVKWSGTGATPPPDAPRYDNLRLYWRTDEGWQLVAWVNEPSA